MQTRQLTMALYRSCTTLLYHTPVSDSEHCLPGPSPSPSHTLLIITSINLCTHITLSGALAECRNPHPTPNPHPVPNPHPNFPGPAHTCLTGVVAWCRSQMNPPPLPAHVSSLSPRLPLPSVPHHCHCHCRMQESADASETGRCDDYVVAKSEEEAMQKARQQ